MNSDTSSCPACGSAEPARLGFDSAGTSGCSDCLTYRRCDACSAWTGEEYGRPAHRAPDIDGRVLRLCQACFEILEAVA